MLSRFLFVSGFLLFLDFFQRWQRRWFVLYDDGELTYSVDDLPATIPQGVVDMNRVLEVSQAEDVTGNQYSLAITAPDRVTFIKGTCREETRWWHDVLSVFPRTQQKGRHKRNATFPGIKSPSGTQHSFTSRPCTTTLGHQRVRFHSCNADPRVGGNHSSSGDLAGISPSSTSASLSNPVNTLTTAAPTATTTVTTASCKTIPPASIDMDEDVFPTKDSGLPPPSVSSSTPTPMYHLTPLTSLPPCSRLLRQERKENTPLYNEADYIDNPPTSESPPTQDKLSHKVRTRRVIKREARGLTQARSKSELSTMFPSVNTTSMTPSTPTSTSVSTPGSPLSHGLGGSSAGGGGGGGFGDGGGGIGGLASGSCLLLKHSTDPSSSAFSNQNSYASTYIPTNCDVGRTITLTSSLTSLLPSSSTNLTMPTSSSSVPSSSSSKLTHLGCLASSSSSSSSSLRSYDSGLHAPVIHCPANDRGELSRQILMTDLEETKREEKLKDIADSITRIRSNTSSTSTNSSPSVAYISSSVSNREREVDVKPTRERDIVHESNTSSSIKPSLTHSTTDSSRSNNVQDEPDGCPLDVAPAFVPIPDLPRVDLPAEDLLNIKKGWLMKQTLNKEWSKYWFVLKGTALMFYRDPSAEDNGILDGIIDLGMASSIDEVDVARNYGFVIKTWEEKKYVFSAVTSGIRSNWVQALRNAANLKETDNRPLTLGEQIEREITAKKTSKSQEGCDSMAAERDQDSVDPQNDSVPNTQNCSVFSSDDEYRTASETSGITKDPFLELGEEEEDSDEDENKVIFTTPNNHHYYQCSSGHSTHIPTSQSTTNLPDSPLLAHTPICRVKASADRSRSRSTSRCRVSKRSRSSPPSSRRNTREDFPKLDCNDLKQSCFPEAGSHSSVSDLGYRERPEKDSSEGTLVGSGDAVLVNLLETKVESLKAKLEETQSPCQIPSTKLELSLAEDHETINTLTSELAQMQKKLEVCEGDLDRSEREVDKLVKEKEDLLVEGQNSRRRIASLEIQVKELLGRVEEQEQNLMEKVEWSNKFSELQKRSAQSSDKHISDVEMVKVASQVMAERFKAPRADRNLKFEKERIELLRHIEALSDEITRLRETLKSEKSEVYKWKDLVKELRSLLDGKNEDIEQKRSEVEELSQTLRTTLDELESTKCKLLQGIEENESLCSRVRELERQVNSPDKGRRVSSNLSISSSRERFSSKRNLPRMDSLSDLTNFDGNLKPEDLDKDHLVDEYSELKIRFDKAVSEIHALKRELKEVQNQQDDMELINLKLRQNLKEREDDNCNQMQLMGSKIQDLTNKLTVSEKQVRSLKQKVSRAESRDRRRTQSLKGKESFCFTKEMETKLMQLEAKVRQFEQRDSLQSSKVHVESMQEMTTAITSPRENSSRILKAPKRSKSFDESTKSSRPRRKSLESPSSSEAMKAILRMNSLESKVASISEEGKAASSFGKSSLLAPRSKSPNRPRSPTHLVSPLKSPLRSPSLAKKTLRSPRLTPEKNLKSSKMDTDGKSVREKALALERVLSTLQSSLEECLAWAGSVEYACSCGAPGLSSLLQQLKSAIRLTQLRYSPVDQTSVTRLQPLVMKVQDLLKDKLTELNQRREHLKVAGKWNRESQLKLFAERLSCETIQVSHLAQVLQVAQRPGTYETSVQLQELIETHRKLSFLEKKLTNSEFDIDTMSPLDFYTSLLAEKLVVQGEVAAAMAPPKAVKAQERKLNDTCIDLQKRLLEREHSLANLFMHYKNAKLQEVAVVMAKDTIQNPQPHDDTVLLEEVHMREAWTIAQELVNQELVNVEASQCMMRLAHLIMPPDAPVLITYPTIAALERWHTAAEESLRQEMEESVLTLSNKYEAVLAQYRAGDLGIVETVKIGMNEVLGEFASVVAQKAVIDGQLAVVQGDCEISSTSEPLTIVEENRDIVGSASDVVASEAHLLMFLGGGDSSMESLVQPALDHAEFAFLFNRLSGQCNQELTSLITSVQSQGMLASSTVTLKKETSQALNLSLPKLITTSTEEQQEFTKVLPSPKTRRKGESSVRRVSRRSSDITGMTESCHTCEELHQDIAKLRSCLEIQKAKTQETECKKCPEYRNQLKTLEEDHKIAMSALQSQHELALEKYRENSRHEPPTRDSEDELTALKRRLTLIEDGYETQLASLRQQYEKALTTQPDLTCEENIRQRYQVDIKELRGLCEKGLGAMENSHRRMIAEIEEKHQRELTALQAEKEQALSEETQATLAALDAMRKAHEAEVQREIAKFKEEFLRKMQSGHDISAIHKEHEAEMEDIRHEILSLSEKYSIKCLETASLEEKVESLNKQLGEIHKQVVELESRNKQLKSHLTTQVAQLQKESKRDISTQLKIVEDDLVLKKEEVAKLTQQLQQAQMHEADLGELCRQLGHFLKAERQLRTDEVTSLREKLEHIIFTAANMQEQCTIQQERSGGDSNDVSSQTPTLRRVSSYGPSRSKELRRSPSCPRLMGFTSLLSMGPSQTGVGPAPVTDLPSPLAGMVASRKKVFETAM
ncbi:myosin phosphatase Rho interacting protein outspread isoform X4 [Oratosquilla oratoria]|uniref:myosin phosphatase Rho interacting protein outspread isoform X4 n=1 Tax=Oratosquilla oratoria TaxID=337810 RepID=UPI003F75E5FB